MAVSQMVGLGMKLCFIYFSDCDNNLEQAMVHDLNELVGNQRMVSSQDVNIWVLQDRNEAEYSTAPIMGFNREYTGAMVYKWNHSTTSLDVIEDLGERNSDDPHLLTSFLTEALTDCKKGGSEEFAVVLSSHGSGWNGFGGDQHQTRRLADDEQKFKTFSAEKVNEDEEYRLSLHGLHYAISSSLTTVGIPKLDLLGFDACLMASYAPLAALHGLSKLYVASEAVEPDHGWDYSTLDPSVGNMTAFSGQILDSFAMGLHGRESHRSPKTLTLYDNSKVPAFLTKADEVFQTMTVALRDLGDTQLSTAIGRARLSSTEYMGIVEVGPTKGVADLGMFLQNLLDQCQVPGLAELLDAVNGMTLKHLEGPTTPVSTGTGVFFPRKRNVLTYGRKVFPKWYYETTTDGFTDKWDDFLLAYYRFTGDNAAGANASICNGGLPLAASLAPEPTVSANTTNEGCACLKDWTQQHRSPCHNFCCNPDMDQGGLWCFVQDETCQGKKWGYCDVEEDPMFTPAPTPAPVPDAAGDTCRWANDGECDTPGPCPPGTDTTDCGPSEPVGGARVTVQGCACQQTWHLAGASEACTDYCCNPDHDAGGEWCAVADPSCQGQRWGYCRPAADDTAAPTTGAPGPVPVGQPTTTDFASVDDSCRYANDGMCDEPTDCASGTDCTDCGTCEFQPNDSCGYARDGVCDEPQWCTSGTDCTDCGTCEPGSTGQPSTTAATSVDDSCRWAQDGACDEPTWCASGTDCSDCGTCTPPEPAVDDSCHWAQDGVCDEPLICSSGTDCTDCGTCTPEGRQTVTGCNCAASWTVEIHGIVECTDYCCNPDRDPHGDWCVVDDPVCQQMNVTWGYCQAADSDSTTTMMTTTTPAEQPYYPPSLLPPDDSCRYASDGTCDEPFVCAIGSDCTDCGTCEATTTTSSSSGAAGDDSCRWAQDGQCDEPYLCAISTDCTDCGNCDGPAVGDDSCRFAGDGVCDESFLCPRGTDCTDCGRCQVASVSSSNGTQQERSPAANTVVTVLTPEKKKALAEIMASSGLGSMAAVSELQGSSFTAAFEKSTVSDSCSSANNGWCEENLVCGATTDCTDCRTCPTNTINNVVETMPDEHRADLLSGFKVHRQESGEYGIGVTAASSVANVDVDVRVAIERSGGERAILVAQKLQGQFDGETFKTSWNGALPVLRQGSKVAHATFLTEGADALSTPCVYFPQGTAPKRTAAGVYSAAKGLPGRLVFGADRSEPPTLYAELPKHAPNNVGVLSLVLPSAGGFVGPVQEVFLGEVATRVIEEIFVWGAGGQQHVAPILAQRVVHAGVGGAIRSAEVFIGFSADRDTPVAAQWEERHELSLENLLGSKSTAKTTEQAGVTAAVVSSSGSNLRGAGR